MLVQVMIALQPIVLLYEQGDTTAMTERPTSPPTTIAAMAQVGRFDDRPLGSIIDTSDTPTKSAIWLSFPFTAAYTLAGGVTSPLASKTKYSTVYSLSSSI